MIKIKAIRLKNFCGYRDNQFIFATRNGINDISVLSGENGGGKSSVLDAVRILSSPKELAGRDTKALLKRYVYNDDYDPNYHDIKVKQGLIIPNDMELEGIFETEDGEEKRVLIESSSKRSGIVINELADLKKGSGKNKGKNENTFAYYVDADNPMNMNKFSLPDDYSEQFLDMTQSIYGYPCLLASPVLEKGHKRSQFDDELYDEDYNNSNDLESVTLYDDLIIVKNRNNEDIKVHFKRMSAGEKKIATLLRYLYNPTYIDNVDIILIDNVELHIYWKRHKIMIDKMLEHFPNKQFIVTSHSETMINHISEIRGKTHLFDINEVHNKGIKVL